MMALLNKNRRITLGDFFPYEKLEERVAHIAVNGLTINSRDIHEGDVFVAVKGVRVHGEMFIPAAIAQGAVAVLRESVNDDLLTIQYQNEIPVISVPRLEKSLSEIAGNFYGHPSHKIPVVGITGTNGKTSCAQIYAQLSAFGQKSVGVIGTIGYGICRPNEEAHSCSLELTSTGMTTPDAITTQAICADMLAVDDVSQKVHTIVMEVSSHGLDQGRVSAFQFYAAIFTNLSHDHLDYHGDMDAYGAAKAKLFEMPSLQVAVINIDDEFSSLLMEKIDPSVQVITYSVSNSLADLYLSNIRYGSSQLLADLHYENTVYELSTPLVGRFNLSNVLAILSLFSKEKTFSSVVSFVKYLQPISGRMELIANRAGIQVVVDFAHTPDALKNVLASVCEFSQGKVWCVFGCGGNRDKAKRPLMAAIAERYAQHVIVTSDNPRDENPQHIIDDIVSGFSGDSSYEIIVDREAAIHQAIRQANINDIVIIAGKGHEDYQIIGNKKFPFSDQHVARSALGTLNIISEASHD